MYESAFITFSPKTSNCLEKCLRLQHCLAVSYVSCYSPPAETASGASCTCVTSSHGDMEELGPNAIRHFYICPSDFTTLSLTGSQTLPRPPTLSRRRQALRAWTTSSSTRRMRPTCWEASTSKQVQASHQLSSLSYVPWCPVICVSKLKLHCSVFSDESYFCCSWRWRRQQWWSSWRPDQLIWSEWWIRETLTYF